MKNAENKNICLLLIGLSLCILFPLVWVSIYNRPCADDYDYAYYTHMAVASGGGIIDLLKAAFKTDIYYYNNWQGLYTSAFLLALQPGIWGEQYYAFSTLIIISVSFLFLWGGIHLLLKHLIKNISALCSCAWSLWLISAICVLLPSATEGLYWYNGAMNYLPWAFADVLVIGMVYESSFVTGSKKTVFVLLSSLLSLVVSGANHVTAFENILLLFLISVFFWTRKKGLTPLFALASAIIGFVIVLHAPGTAIRQSRFVQPTVIKTLVESLKYTWTTLQRWMNISWLLVLLSLTPAVIKIADDNKEAFKHFPILELIISFGLLCAMNCVPYYAMGNFGAKRLVNVVWIAFLGLSIFNYTCIIGYLISRKVINSERIRICIPKRSLILIVVCAGLLFFSCESNSIKAVKEIKNSTAKMYALEMDARIELYHNDDLEEVKVSPIQYHDTMLFFSDLCRDPDTWPNTSIGTYYNKKISITTE